jgi:hypothetical protein
MSSLKLKTIQFLPNWILSLDRNLGCTHRQPNIKSVILCVFSTIHYNLRNYTAYVDKDIQPERTTTCCSKHVDYFNGFIQFSACVTGELLILETSPLPLLKKMN